MSRTYRVSKGNVVVVLLLLLALLRVRASGSKSGDDLEAESSMSDRVLQLQNDETGQTFPSVVRLLLMLAPSLSLAPVAPVELARSEPARSTRLVGRERRRRQRQIGNREP